MVAHAFTVGEWILLAVCIAASLYALVAAVAMPFSTVLAAPRWTTTIFRRPLPQSIRQASCTVRSSVRPPRAELIRCSMRA